MPAKILVVEDERDIADLLRYHLEREGFRVVTAASGAQALREVERERPDLVLLDLMIPEGDGLQVCRRLRAAPATARLPIIMLTARAEEVDRVLGLELGADDYVTKPFSPREVMARVKGLLRRAAEPAIEEVYHLGDLTVDVARHVAQVKGRPLSLTPKEFELLRALVEARGRVLTREGMLDRVWGYDHAAEIESRTVDVHIRRLRKKLGPEARRIVTVKGVGYRFDLVD
jgi:two-component system alkaline phosphatase synthesis response regulator PhoP